MPPGDSGGFTSKKDLAFELKRLLLVAERGGRLKRAALARSVGVSASSLYAYLGGTTLPPADVLDRLLDAVDATSAQRQRLVAARDDLDIRYPARDPGVRPAPGELPPDVVGFTGRDAELAWLDDLVGNGQRSAVLISAVDGIPGVGKTALAVHWAHRVRHRFTDGQLYLNLRGYAPTPPLMPIDALARLLRTLGVPAERVPADVDHAAAMYRSLLADKRVLLVLDNAADVEQVRPLLPAGGGSAVLATSRDQLGGLVARDGAYQLNLDVLAAGEARELLTSTVGVQRAHAEPEAVAELAQLCGYLPLALRIAAANLAMRPRHRVADHVAQLRSSDPLVTLAVPGDDHTAVSVAFDQSYIRLSEPARRMFRLLGLATGPDVTAETAAAIADTSIEDAQRQLDQLTRANLLDEHVAGRYTCHDLLRRYAADRALREEAAPDRDAARGRLFACYLNAVDAAARLLYPEKRRLPRETHHAGGDAVEFRGHARALAWVDDELAGLIATVEHTAQHGPRPVAWLLADGLRGYFWRRRCVVEWLAVGEAALAAAQADGDPEAKAAGWFSLGDAHQVRGRPQQAIDHYRHAQVASQQCTDPGIRFAVLNNLGELYRQTGRLREAADCYRQVLEYHRQTDRPDVEAMQLDNLGSVYRAMGQLSRAADHHTQAITIHRRIGNHIADGVELLELGETQLALGRFDRARTLLTEALAINRLVGDRASEADTQRCLAAVHRDCGTPDIDLARAALAIARDIGDSRVEADALNTVASVHHRLRQHQQAVDHHQHALRKAQDSELAHPQAEALIGLAAAHLPVDDHRQAHDYLRQATTIIQRAGFRLLEGQAQTVLAELHLAEDDPDQAARIGEHALCVHRETGHRLGAARTLLILGRTAQHIGDTHTAREHWRHAHALFTDIGTPEVEYLAALL